MPPRHYITFVNGSTEITFGIFCSKKDLEIEGIKKLS